MILLLTTATPLLANTAAERIANLQREIARVTSSISDAEMIYGGGHENTVRLRNQLNELNAELAYEQARQEADALGAPRVALVTPQNITLEAGETQDITITLRNVGTHVLQSLFTTATPSAGSPFVVEFIDNTNSIARVNANQQRSMTMRITVNENASPDNYHITLNHFFQDNQRRPQNSESRINVRIGGITGTPNVRLANFQNMHTGTLAPGQTFTVSANIQNLGTATARDVQVNTPNNMLPEHIVFIESPDSLNRAAFDTMAAGYSSMLSFVFRVDRDAGTGAFPINFVITSNDESGDTIPAVTIPFIVNVEAPDEDDNRPDLEVRGMQSPTGVVRVDQNARIAFYLYNSGEVEARNIRVTATPPTGIAPAAGGVVQTIPSLASGESRQVVFNFRPESAARTQSYTIRFDAAFQLGRTGESDTVPIYAWFNVYNPDDDDDETHTQIPIVIVSEHSIYPATPRAGEEFEMTITFRNTNATRSINNMRIRLEEQRATNVGGQQGQQIHFAGLTPIGGSNTLFIESIPPRGEVTKNLRFSTSADATPGTHNLEISYNYQCPNGTFPTQNDDVLIAFQVAQVMSLELAEVNIPDHTSVGSSVWFSFRIINNGRVNLSNMRVRLEGPFDTAEAGGEDGMFITPINAQRFTNFEGRFTPFEAGMQRGYFIVSGADNTGETIELRHAFSLMVDEGWDFGGGDWPYAWDDGFGGGGMVMPGRPFPGDGGMHFGMEEPDEPNFVVRFFRNIYTRPIAPDWWEEEFMGEFNELNAAMMGVEPDTAIDWVAIILTFAGIGVICGAAALVIRNKRRSRINFDDFDDED